MTTATADPRDQQIKELQQRVVTLLLEQAWLKEQLREAIGEADGFRRQLQDAETRQARP